MDVRARSQRRLAHTSLLLVPIWVAFLWLTLVGPNTMTVSEFGQRSNTWSPRPTRLVPKSVTQPSIPCPRNYDPRKFVLNDTAVRFSTQDGLFASDGVILLVDDCETDLIGFPQGSLTAKFYGPEPFQTLQLVDPLPLYRAIALTISLILIATVGRSLSIGFGHLPWQAKGSSSKDHSADGMAKLKSQPKCGQIAVVDDAERVGPPRATRQTSDRRVLLLRCKALHARSVSQFV
jgi:hypothetical protein